MQNFSLMRLTFCLLVILVVTGCATFSEQAPQTAEVGTQNTESESTEVPFVPAVDQFKRTRKSLSEQQLSIANQLHSAMSGDSSSLQRAIDTASSYLQTNVAAPSMLWLAIGDAYAKQQEKELAEQAWSSAVRINASNYFAHDRLGQHFRRSGQFTLAMQHYDRAIQAWPDFANGYRHRGILHDLYLGNKAAALADYQQWFKRLSVFGADEKTTREAQRWIKEMQREIDNS